jgi:hypothetical protein
MRKVIIETADLRLSAELNDTDTARAIYAILPVSGTANVWGEEIYFGIPLRLDPSPDARQEVEVGDLTYWPSGDAFCIFFGPTPVSTDKKPLAYSPVNVFGKIHGDATVLKKVNSGEQVIVNREESS